MTLLPADFDAMATEAVRAFWLSRAKASSRGAQGGTRDAVIAGKNMDGFVELVRAVSVHCGLPDEAVQTRRGSLVLPGFFRATKNWDVLIVHQRRLLAVFEFKSQVGSFGNNFNNRSEEVIGAAADLWVAHHHRAYSPSAEGRGAPLDGGLPLPALNPTQHSDPRPPFLGWLMLLEESKGSLAEVRCDEPHYPVFPEFRGASYARRYQILCERLMERQLYGAASLVLSPAREGAATGAHRCLSPATSLRNLYGELAAKLLAALET